MVNESLITDVVENIDVNQGLDYVSYLSRTISGQIVQWLATKGIEVSLRWASFFVLFISVLIIYIGIKISKGFIKWALIILGILLLLGLVVPIW